LAWQRPLAIILGLGLIGETLYILFFQANELVAVKICLRDLAVHLL